MRPRRPTVVARFAARAIAERARSLPSKLVTLSILTASATLSAPVLSAPKQREPEAPTLPAPDVRLEIHPAPADELWQMEVTNAGSVPLRIVADARLLRLRVMPPGGAAPPPAARETHGKEKKAAPFSKTKGDAEGATMCALPASMRSDQRTLVLPPGGRYLEAFDPRLFCLDASRELGPGATVIARLGWAPPAKARSPLPPPFVEVPHTIAGAAPTVAPVKEIAAAPLVLGATTAGAGAVVTGPSQPPSTHSSSPASPRPPASSSPASSSSPSPRASASSAAAGAKEPPSASSPPPIVLKHGPARSVYSGDHVELSVIARNDLSKPIAVYARPQLVRAKVRTPHGDVVSCKVSTTTPAPLPDFTVRLPAHGAWSANVSLSGACPRDTFATPGLYEVTPIIVAPPIPYVSNDVSGQFEAASPQLIRVETGSAPYHDAPPLVSPRT